jgi:hypothetical protein
MPLGAVELSPILYALIWIIINDYACIWMKKNLYELTWIYTTSMNLCDLIWIYMNCYEFIWIDMDLYELIWMYTVCSYEFTWIFVNVCACMWFYLLCFDLFRTCTHFVWIYLNTVCHGMNVSCVFQPLWCYRRFQSPRSVRVKDRAPHLRQVLGTRARHSLGTLLYNAIIVPRNVPTGVSSSKHIS